MVEELLSMGEKVVAVTTKMQKINKLFSNLVELIFFDFTDINTFDKALEDVGRVFLIGNPYIEKLGDLYPLINAMKAHNILKVKS